MQYADVVDSLPEAVPEIRKEIEALKSEFAPDPIGAYNVLDEVWSSFLVSRLRSAAESDMRASWQFVEVLARSPDPECAALVCELAKQLFSAGVLEAARPCFGTRTADLVASVEPEWGSRG